MGKTTLLRQLLSPLPSRLVVVDSLGELSRKGFVQGVTPDEFGRILTERETYAVGVYPDSDETFEWVCDAAAARSDITLAIDELDRWLPTTSHLPPQSLLDMSLTGGHYGQHLICIVHRPAGIHHAILSQSTVWVFPMFDANDRRTVQKHTARPNNPAGVDPGELAILESDERGWTQRVEVARVSHTEVQHLAFDLRTGVLTSL